MNALSTFTMKLNLRSSTAPTQVHRREENPRQVAARQVIAGFAKRTRLNGITPDYRLGGTVRHTRFGTGRVVARMPDGRLQIRFEGVRKSQMIFPSLLEQ